MVERIDVAELHKRMKAQGVSSRDHIAFTCPICGTVQSMASLVRAGANPDRVESIVGFSCEGRLTGAGAWPATSKKSKKAAARRMVRGCDWTLGGLFQLHKLEVVTPDGKTQPSFVLASPDEASALEAQQRTIAA